MKRGKSMGDSGEWLIWTPELKFVCCFFLSSFISFCWELNSDEKRTFLQILGATFLYGAAGAGFGGIMGRWITGKSFPIIDFSCGMLVGARALPLSMLGSVVLESLSSVGRFKDETKEDRRKRRNERTSAHSTSSPDGDSKCDESDTPSDKK